MTASIPNSSPAAPPRPQIFAIMRNGHEVIRGCMKDIERALANDNLAEAKGLWDKLHKWDNLHMRMEEGRPGGAKGIFALLDEHGDGIAQNADLRYHHENLYEYEEDIQDAFDHAENASEAVKASFASFQKENLLHLEKEEKVMMPVIQSLMKSGKPMKKYMREDLMPLIPKSDMEFFVKFANEVLSRHEDNMPRVRVFNHALWAVATSQEWELWSRWMKEVLPASKYDETIAAVQAFKAFQTAEAGKANKNEDSAPINPPVVVLEGMPRVTKGGGWKMRDFFSQKLSLKTVASSHSSVKS